MKSFRVYPGGRKENLYAVAQMAVAVAFTWALMTKRIRLSEPWFTILFFGGVAALWIGGSLRKYIGSLWSPRVPKMPRPSPASAKGFLAWQVILVLLILFSRAVGGWTPRSVGWKEEYSPPLAFLLGFACYAPAFLGMLWLRRFWIGKEEALRNWEWSMRSLVPRTGRERAQVWTGLLLNPFTEEFVFRGVLVCMLAEEGIGVAPAVILGAVLCVAGHLYQGRYQVPFHLSIFATSVALLYSPLGLWGSFGMHFAGDLVPMLRFRGNLEVLRGVRGVRLSTAYAATAASQRSSRSKSSTDA